MTDNYFPSALIMPREVDTFLYRFILLNNLVEQSVYALFTRKHSGFESGTLRSQERYSRFFALSICRAKDVHRTASSVAK